MLIVFIFISNISTPTFNLNHKFKNSLAIIFPQKWYFFTVSGKQNSLSCYKITTNKKLIEVTYQNAKSGSFGGVNRKFRSTGASIYNIFKIIPDSLWTSYSSNTIINIDSVKVFIAKKKQMMYLDCKNEYLLETRTKVPWIWSNNDSISVNMKIVRIKII